MTQRTEAFAMTASQGNDDAIHEFLLSPEAYAERPKRVDMKETHISWVYLTDRYVYKRKKPVKFEFLDFSTLPRRKSYCEREVELNRRFSPDVYLGTVPVSSTKNGFQLKPGNNQVEWLVKMRRLDESKTLESLIQNEQLTPLLIEQLSKPLTGFYASAAPAMLRSEAFLRSLKHHILANQEDIVGRLSDSEATIQFVTNAQLRSLSLESDYFMQRVADGRVVDGHGDLRPEHIYFRRGQPAIIDCVEFSAEYRTNDVIDELSFLAMECDRLGNQEIGRAILEEYLSTCNDDIKPFLVAFYKCYRACVRAKVAVLRAGQSTQEKSASLMELAAEYLRLAQTYASSLGPKLILMVGGLSGTGKSTISKQLSEQLSAELLQTDVIRRELDIRKRREWKVHRKRSATHL